MPKIQIDYNLKRHDLLMLLMGVYEKEKNYEMPVPALTAEWLTQVLNCTDSDFKLVISELLKNNEIADFWKSYGYQITQDGMMALSNEKYIHASQQTVIKRTEFWKSKYFVVITIASIILGAVIKTAIDYFANLYFFNHN